MQPFEEAYATYLQPAEQALITASPSPSTYSLIINLYTSLFRHWATKMPPGSNPPRPGPVLAHADQRMFASLASHIDQMSTSLLVSLPTPNLPLTSTILTFYETTSTSTLPDCIPILLPPTALTYLLALTPSSTPTLTRTAGITASLKSALDTHPKHLITFYDEASIDTFNRSLRDLFNLLWISRALTLATDKTGRPNSLGMHCDPALREALNTYLDDLDHKYAVQTAFGVSYGPCLAAMSAAAWRELEEAEIRRRGYDRGSITWHEGPVSQRSLEVLRRNGGVDVEWEAYRVDVLKWLERRGCGGLKEFLFASSKVIRDKYEEG